MNVLINGAGITGMILCDVLKTEHPDWYVKVCGYLIEPQDFPLLLDLSQIRFQPDAFYYLAKRNIKVGYTKNGLRTILEKPTDEMLEMYYKKQGREKTSSSMSNSNQEYEAIDLRDWYELAKKRCGSLVEDKVKGEFDIIFETKANCDLIDNVKKEKEYILPKQCNLKGFDYVYDCSNNDIKRYNPKCVEMLKPTADTVLVSNYYRSPRIFSEYDTTNGIERIYVSRNATKSQLKVVDMLNYVNYRWGDKYEN